MLWAASDRVFSLAVSLRTRLSPEAENLVQQRRAEYISEHGDPFTLWNIYSAWLQVKRDRRQNSRKWCRQIGVEEQRLYEMTKLVDQFQSILDIHLADRSGEQEDLMDLADDENRPLKKRRRRRNAEAYARLQRFRGQQMEADGRGKQLKTTEEMEMLAAGAASDEEDHGGVGGNDDIGEDLHALEFDTRQDMAALEEQWAQFRPGAMSPNQIVILKLILCSGLYPNIAFPDGANYGRKQSEQMYHTRKKRFVVGRRRGHMPSFLPPRFHTSTISSSFTPPVFLWHPQSISAASRRPWPLLRVQTSTWRMRPRGISTLQAWPISQRRPRISPQARTALLLPLHRPATALSLAEYQNFSVISSSWKHSNHI